MLLRSRKYHLFFTEQIGKTVVLLDLHNFWFIAFSFSFHFSPVVQLEYPLCRYCPGKLSLIVIHGLYNMSLIWRAFKTVRVVLTVVICLKLKPKFIQFWTLIKFHYTYNISLYFNINSFLVYHGPWFNFFFNSSRWHSNTPQQFSASSEQIIKFWSTLEKLKPSSDLCVICYILTHYTS